jgi:hypothetical protein
MAETHTAAPSETITHNDLEHLFLQRVEIPLNQGAAAALTVAFEIRKAAMLARGEQVSDSLIKEEIRKIYLDMMALTDPTTNVTRAQHVRHPPRRQT